MSSQSIETPTTTTIDLTPRQRMVVYLFSKLSDDMQTGTVEEQHTAALLRLVADAVSRGYAGELVRVGREWRAAREKLEGEGP
jgi:hypothetical protein